MPSPLYWALFGCLKYFLYFPKFRYSPKTPDFRSVYETRLNAFNSQILNLFISYQSPNLFVSLPPQVILFPFTSSSILFPFTSPSFFISFYFFECEFLSKPPTFISFLYSPSFAQIPLFPYFISISPLRFKPLHFYATESSPRHKLY